MPLVLVAIRVQPAYLASWANALHVFHNRHPEVAAKLVTTLDDEPDSRFCSPRRELGGMWRSRPETSDPELYELGTSLQRWQLEASTKDNTSVFLFSREFHNRCGHCGIALTVAPTSRETTIPHQIVLRDSPPRNCR